MSQPKTEAQMIDNTRKAAAAIIKAAEGLPPRDFIAALAIALGSTLSVIWKPQDHDRVFKAVIDGARMAIEDIQKETKQ